MDIMLTVSYSVEIPEDQFFCPETGYVKEEIQKRLEQLFPEEIVLTGNAAAQRQQMIHCPMHEDENVLRCASCGRWLYMPEKEHPPVCLEPCRMVREIPLCSGCAWELERDLKDEEFVRKLKEKRFQNSGNKRGYKELE